MTDTSVPDAGTQGTWPQAMAAARSQPFPWWSLFITGLLGVVFGAAVLIWPDLSLRIMAALAGIWLFLAGLARLIGSLLPRGGGSPGTSWTPSSGCYFSSWGWSACATW
ncbi:MAG: DUF308 domain-containing protein [Actinoplanes sp.]